MADLCRLQMFENVFNRMKNACSFLTQLNLYARNKERRAMELTLIDFSGTWESM